MKFLDQLVEGLNVNSLMNEMMSPKNNESAWLMGITLREKPCI
jgi:hypothetical protein